MSHFEQITPELLKVFKTAGRKFACVTAYDMPSARLADEAGIELVLVGDSLGMTVLGLESTRSVTFDNMLYHLKAVRRGLKHALLVIDMPYETVKNSDNETLSYAKRFIAEGGADAIKIEGPVFDLIRQLRAAKIPVVAHLGLTPQAVRDGESFKVQAKTGAEAERLIQDARKIEEAGAFALVLECIPWQTAKQVSESLKIPTIGIGAGPGCDAQILVWHDLLGWNPEKKFKFVRRYAQFGVEALRALAEYKSDVVEGRFPALEESFGVQREKNIL